MSERCPYCNKEMELGYIQCRDGITWTKKVQPIAALSWLSSSSIILKSAERVFGGAVLEAYICRDCKKVLMDLNV